MMYFIRFIRPDFTEGRVTANSFEEAVDEARKAVDADCESIFITHMGDVWAVNPLPQQYDAFIRQYGTDHVIDM